MGKVWHVVFGLVAFLVVNETVACDTVEWTGMAVAAAAAAGIVKSFGGETRMDSADTMDS